MSLSEVDYGNDLSSTAKIFITEQNTVFLNRVDACGFCYEFVMKNEINIFTGCCLKDIINIKVSMGIKELYVEIDNDGMNKFIRIEDESKIVNESELCINSFSKRLITKLHTRERDVKIEGLLSHLKVNDAKKALQLIQFIKIRNILNSGDVYNLYSLYVNHLKIVAPKFVDNNIFYLKRLVLGLINLGEINIIL
ncbi:TPA: hypothetical protein ACROWE_001116 [Escherichia coli]|nr:hypothetical protein [Escherichia coli]HDS2484001.1 hypothetical protein [Escherichia coli]